MKALYSAVKAQLQAIPELAYVARYNNQFEQADQGAVFNMPAAFIQLANITYADHTKGIQTASVTIRVHLGIDRLVDSEFALFDLRALVNQKLHGYKSIGQKAATLSRVSEQADDDHGNVEVWQMDYQTSFIEESVYIERGYINVAPVALQILR